MSRESVLSPRVARELHAGNHRERNNDLYVTLPAWTSLTCSISFTFTTRGISLSRDQATLPFSYYTNETDVVPTSMRALLVIAIVGLAHGQEYFREPEKVLSESRDLGDTRGHYSFAYETEGGILQKESGSRKYAGTPDETQLIQGSVQYNAPDGTPIAMSWTADEFGTQVSGTHIPTPPPIPPAIQRALEWIAKQPSTSEQPDLPQPHQQQQQQPKQQPSYSQNAVINNNINRPNRVLSNKRF
ncbi:larval cuticle protein LCP-22-like isoform X2 [Vespa mandarinia]|uniref:larval cuticle protein LCP-22-like isoform X2 n=1 Tax=Vespa mandarinia TaxID=7446 RepID=UPI001616D570|nr:larval cuticle protein LCP-22-like isoform X2 [Vespa mandarinia]